MKNVSSLKSNSTNSPKTPGGISKSLLTPCRRLGLSRNWRNKGPSPFVSPLAGSTQEVKEEKIETRKRKQRVLGDNVESTPETTTVDGAEIEADLTQDNDKTPSRNVDVPRRKKSKTLLAAINKSQEDLYADLVTTSEDSVVVLKQKIPERDVAEVIETNKVVSTPVRSKSKKSKKQSPRLKSEARSKVNSNSTPDVCIIEQNSDANLKGSADAVYKIKEKSPNDLKKECVVVIQRKIFKKTEDSEKESNNTIIKKDNTEKLSSQALFDYDSDEAPLIQLNNKELSKSQVEKITKEVLVPSKTENKTNLIEDDDFVDKSSKLHSTKVKDSKSPKNKLKTTKTSKPKVEKVKVQPKPSPSQSSFDDDDDFDTNKKTILIRKTYEKVSKPLKAKSTGSITQKDIDELKARIEAKKKLLLAQSLNPDTEELRTLIKKWQKGCQDALIELLDLMKTKCQDKQDMGYSEMLKSLKIPPSLIGYDAENDCFNEPNDASVILGQFEDIIS